MIYRLRLDCGRYFLFVCLFVYLCKGKVLTFRAQTQLFSPLRRGSHWLIVVRTKLIQPYVIFPTFKSPPCFFQLLKFSKEGEKHVQLLNISVYLKGPFIFIIRDTPKHITSNVSQLVFCRPKSVDGLIVKTIFLLTFFWSTSPKNAWPLCTFFRNEWSYQLFSQVSEYFQDMKDWSGFF